MKNGTVYLVGAGPGDPELITLKALKCLKETEVVIYDRLISRKILDNTNKECEKIYVGKAPGKHRFLQDEINNLLIKKAKEGKKVVRLKGGDPFVFGRGGEEALALKRAGIPFKIIPGITSCVAVPEYAGIPVTHRGTANSFHVFTGHDVNGECKIEWEYAAKLKGSLIFLMGMGNIDLIMQNLIKYGQSPERPAAVIYYGTTHRQKTLISTLKDMEREIRINKIAPPAVIVVGETVLLGKELRWFEF